MIYLDNAATTPLSEEVKKEIVGALDNFGNPSSTHAQGRKAKILVEKTRKAIAQSLNCEPGEIFFTSGGTEADNFALVSGVRDLGVKTIISSPIEHKAVISTIEALEKSYGISVKWLTVSENGSIDLEELNSFLSESAEKKMVSLMHANNEIGNLIDIEKVGALCKEHQALFHSDTVQSFAHMTYDLKKLPIHFMNCSAHKFHGPKGIGFCYVKSGLKIKPLIEGGGQERNLRAGTENVLGIVGLNKAFEQVLKHRAEAPNSIRGVKQYAIEQVKQYFPEVGFNGLSADMEKSIPTVLSLSFPKNAKTDMLLFLLDIEEIAVSGGSACNSGAVKGSHVINELNPEGKETVNIRISFSRYTQKSDIDFFIEKLKKVLS